MKKTTIKFLLGFIILASSNNCIAQIKTTVPTPGQQKDRVNAQKTVQQAAANEKILNAKLVSLKLNVFSDNPSSGFFKKREFSLKGLGSNQFKTPVYTLQNAANFSSANGVSTWQFTSAQGEADKDGFGGIKPDTYRSFLENGFNASITFGNRADRILESECFANFSIEFLFSDGNRVIIPLQGITVVGNKGSFRAGPKRPLVVNKNIPGSDFPDPNNPVIIKAPN